MAERASSNNTQQNRIKLLLIPVLGVIMLYVLFAPGEQAPVPTLVARLPEGSANGTESAPTEASTQAVTWPTIPLAEVLARNPFERPEGLKPIRPPEPEVVPEPVVEVEPVRPPVPVMTAEEQTAREQALAEELQNAAKKYRLTALVRTSNGLGAMVGDNVVTVGQTLDDRFRVAAIRPDGVVLEMIAVPVDATGAANKSPVP